MRHITSNLWFDTQSEEAVNFYISLFDNSKIIKQQILKNTPSGDPVLLDFQLNNLRFTAIDGGPMFQLNPSISIMVSCENADQVDELYHKLAEGGSDLMPLDTYPFSPRYAWVADRFGLTWQIMVDDNYDPDHNLSICLLFAGKACGKAHQALDFYHDLFENSRIGGISHYQEGEASDDRAKINYAELFVHDDKLVLMDHGLGGDFTFNEAFSLGILCSSQAEIDYYWDHLTHVPEAEACGWLKDKFGLSWQVTPVHLDDWMTEGTEEDNDRVTQAMLQMKKIIIKDLENARYGF